LSGKHRRRSYSFFEREKSKPRIFDANAKTIVALVTLMTKPIPMRTLPFKESQIDEIERWMDGRMDRRTDR